MGIIAEAIISSPPDFLPSLLVVLGLLTGRSDSGPWINKNKALRRLRVSAVEVFFPAPTLWALGPLKNVGAGAVELDLRLGGAAGKARYFLTWQLVPLHLPSPDQSDQLLWGVLFTESMNQEA